jgi:tripartite-type tricarboxylate transporter receptor subunit TctC
MNFRTWVKIFLPALLWGAAGAQAAAFPERPVLMVVAGNPGGGLDLTGRALEQAMLETRLVPSGFVLRHMGGAGGSGRSSWSWRGIREGVST